MATTWWPGRGTGRSRASSGRASQLGQRRSWNFSHTRGMGEEDGSMAVPQASATVARPRVSTSRLRRRMAAKSLIMRSAMWPGSQATTGAACPRGWIQHSTRAADRPHDVGVGDHRALSRPGRAARVDEGGDLLGRHRARLSLEQVGLAPERAAPIVRSRTPRSRGCEGHRWRVSSPKTTMWSSLGSLSLTARILASRSLFSTKHGGAVRVAEHAATPAHGPTAARSHSRSTAASIGDVPLRVGCWRRSRCGPRARSRARPAGGP